MRLIAKHFLTTCLVGGSLFVGSSVMRADSMVAVTAKFSMEKTPVTQGEPAVLQIAFDNRSGHGVVINLGYQDEKLDITVVDPDGLVSHKPRPTVREGWGPVDAFIAAAGETSPGSVSLSDWFVFKKVGTYRIDVSLSPISSRRSPLPTALVAITPH